MIKVSVLTPIYNSAKYLSQCLASLSAQTMPEIEFICINDGSSDASPEILKHFAQTDDRFKIINKPNSGYGASMNVGLKAARGQYIGIVEADDYAKPDMFERLYKLAKTHEADIAGSNRFDLTDTFDRFNEVMNGLEYDRVFSPLDNQEIFLPAPCIWSKIYRKDFLDNYNINFLETPRAAFQDTSFVYKSYFAADRVVFTQEAFLHYRISNQGKSVKATNNIYAILDEFDAIDDFIVKYPNRAQRFHCYSDLRVQAYLWNYNRLPFFHKLKFKSKMKANLQGSAAKNLFCFESVSPARATQLNKIIRASLTGLL